MPLVRSYNFGRSALIWGAPLELALCAGNPRRIIWAWSRIFQRSDDPGDDGRFEHLLGDIVLAHGVCARDAAERGIAMTDHAAHLIVHGCLHLIGYDHETGDADAEDMERVERQALAALGISDPYALQPVLD